MKTYKTIMKASVVVLTSMLVMACNESSETQSGTNDADPVVLAAKPTVALTDEQINAAVGEAFTVEIAMSDFPVSEGGGVNVKFDPAILNATDVIINTGDWNFVNKVGEINNDTGVISDILFSSYNGVSTDSSVATITFNAVGGGNSQITLAGSGINPFSSEGEEIEANFIHTNVQVSGSPIN